MRNSPIEGLDTHGHWVLSGDEVPLVLLDVEEIVGGYLSSGSKEVPSEHTAWEITSFVAM